MWNPALEDDEDMWFGEFGNLTTIEECDLSEHQIWRGPAEDPSSAIVPTSPGIGVSKTSQEWPK